MPARLPSLRRGKRDHGWHFTGGVLNHTTFIQSLRSTVRKHEATYQRAREREQVLTPYATGAALFAALSPASKLGSDARRALLLVVVAEYQVARHPLWHALAACALQPMLGGLRARLRHLDPEDREQALQTALIEGLGRLRIDRGAKAFPLLTLRRWMERALIDAERTKRELEEDEVSFDEAAEGCLQAPHLDPTPYVHCLAHEIGELVAERAGGDDVVRVLAGAETLDEQAERLASTEATYECLQMRHWRALDDVRRELSRRSR